jgi:pimeloyl-ACP methyl ester carboxylesterase
LFRAFVDIASVAMRRGNGNNELHSLPKRVRAQTALDYTRTAPGVYHLPGRIADISEYLPRINIPTLVVWGARDQTLAPASFPKLVKAMPHAKGKSLDAGHVPHQSNAEEFNALALEFLKGL